MASSSTGGKKTALVSPTRRTVPQTKFDLLREKRVISSNTEKKREKAVGDAKFQTRSFRHINSSWTPIVHKASNEQIYKERRELVCNWFDLWSDSQRKRFLDLLFRHCKRTQLLFIYDWFDHNVPRKRHDFTRTLPRCLSLYIFTFLDPRSLCRAAQVSWHWKFLTEQDTVWRPKCMKLGWYLPYEPEDNEYGAWKKHYVSCTFSLDTDVPSKYISSLYGSRGDGTNVKKPKNRSRLRDDFKEDVLTARPAWKDPDPVPDDMERAYRALCNDVNPNDPNVPKSLLLHHTKFGQTKRSSMRQTAHSYGLEKTERKAHRALTLDDFPASSYTEPLSHSLSVERAEETRMMRALSYTSEPLPPAKRAISAGKDVSGGRYPLPWKQASGTRMSKSYMHQANPRVIFISSRVPAADLLVDAVLFGVIPIVYEYEGTTLESLKAQLDSSLQGRDAQSIGIFPHSNLAWELRLVSDVTVNVDNLDDATNRNFFETVASHVLPPEQGGHIDFFTPLGASEAGHKLMTDLNDITGVHYSAPTGIIGNYNHVSGEWSDSPEDTYQPSLYFCHSKLNVWSNTADQAKEACQQTRRVLGKYFQQKHHDVMSQLVGQVVFDALGQGSVHRVNDLSQTLTDGLVSLSKEQAEADEEHCVNPYTFLADYLRSKAGQEPTDDDLFKQAGPEETMAAQKTMRKPLSHELQLSENYESGVSGHTLSEDDEVAAINGMDQQQTYREKLEEADDIDDEAHEDGFHDNLNNNNNGSGDEAEQTKTSRTDTRFSQPQLTRSLSPTNGHTGYGGTKDLGLSLRSTGEWGDTMRSYHETLNGLTTSRGSKDQFVTPRRITAMSMEAEPDRRALAARELLASETDYLRTLELIKNTFFLPLKNALASNRAVISAHNVQLIFSDAMTLHALSRRLLDELRMRCSEWSPSQCLGDVFVKFSGKLKAYANFVNNYPMILSTIERCTEQNPSFRAFLNRHERTSDSKMMTLAELLLWPTRRVDDYASLLAWFEQHTPPDHADRGDLRLSIRSMAELSQLISDCRDRSDREREIVALQKQIVNCPTLLEANRYLLRHLDAASLEAPLDSVSPELRTYKHLKTLGLFLFNDALVVTRRNTRNVPFARCVEQSYVFEACSGLQRLRVEDIPDSKYVRNAFRMFTPRRSWVCSTDTQEEKLNWVTLLENTVRTALESR